MKKYIIGQYFPYLIMGVYGVELNIPESIFEKEVEGQVSESCEKWFNKLKEELEKRYKDSVKVHEVVSYSFRRFSSRDLLEMPFVIDSSLYIDNVLNQHSSLSKVAEFSVLIEVNEEKEKEILDYLLEGNYYYKENQETENMAFEMT
jgi:translation elongation factor EF-Ts